MTAGLRPPGPPARPGSAARVALIRRWAGVVPRSTTAAGVSGGHARPQQPGADGRQGGHPHEKHQGAPRAPPGPRRGWPAPRAPPGAWPVTMCRELSPVPVGHRNPRPGGGGQSGGDPGDHPEGDPRPGQGLALLAAPAEEEGVAALEANHPLPRPGLLGQDAVDLLLGHRVAAGVLAHVDFLRAGWDEGQNPLPHQPVIHHNLGALQGCRPARVSSPASPGPAPTRMTSPVIPRPLSSAGPAPSPASRARPPGRGGSLSGPSRPCR